MKPISLLVFALVLSGCSSKPIRPPTDAPTESMTLGDLSRFLTEIEHSSDVVVYEGLPHQLWDRELFEVEIKRTDLVRIEGYPFYAKPLQVSDEDKVAVSRIAASPSSHSKFSGFKLCGGYHPDYAVTWEREGRRSGVLICFGCHEWKLFTPDGRLYEDIASDAYKELHAILSPYVSQRPKNKRG